MEKNLDLNTELNFGKYKGKTAVALIDLDIHYLYWLKNETDWNLSEELKKAMTQCLDDRAGHNAFVSTKKEDNYKHDASYGQAFDNCAGGMMY